MQPDDPRSFVFDALSRLPDVDDPSLVRMIEASLASKAINLLPVMLFALDAEGRYILAEGGGLDRLGRTSAEFIGESYTRVHAANPVVLDAIRHALEGRNVEGKMTIGETTYQASFQPLLLDDVVSSVIAVAFDITERERSERLLASVVEESTDAIVVASAAGEILRFNPAAERMFGYSADDVIQTPVTRLVTHEFRDRYRQGLDGDPGLLGNWLRLRGLCADGDDFPLDLHVLSLIHI